MHNLHNVVHHKGDDSVSRLITMRKEVGLSLTVAVVASIMCVAAIIGSMNSTIEGPKPQTWFYLSAWDYPDSYSQGIEGFYIYENSTGSWEHIDQPWHVYYDYTHDGYFNWTEFEGAAIKLECFTWFNSTITESADTTEGLLYQRHNVTVMDINLATVVFSQNNFTYVANYTYAAPMWYYQYEVVLDFIPQAASQYVVTVSYEVYYRE